MSAIDFFTLMTVGQLGMKHPSLAAMVEAIKVAIRREGMHRRFSASAVAFMRNCAEFVLKQKAFEMTRLRVNILQYFKRILIFDSTGWDISPEVANERQRKLKRRSQKAKSTPSEYHSLLADWTLMVTNVPEEWLSAEMIRPFYSLRWQIELLFKQIKSILCIHHSNTGKENRLRCEIYGKLITAVMIHRIHADINIRLWNTTRRELSMEKLYKRLQERAFIILDLLLASLQKAIAYLQDEIPRLIKNCLKSRQRSRRTTLEIIQYGPLSSGNAVMLDAA